MRHFLDSDHVIPQAALSSTPSRRALRYGAYPAASAHGSEPSCRPTCLPTLSYGFTWTPPSNGGSTQSAGSGPCTSELRWAVRTSFSNAARYGKRQNCLNERTCRARKPTRLALSRLIFTLNACRAAYEQLHLLRIADQLNVGQRFRKTVRLGTLISRTGNGNRHTVLLKRNETYYDVAHSHEVGQGPLRRSLICRHVHLQWVAPVPVPVVGFQALRHSTHLINKQVFLPAFDSLTCVHWEAV